MASDDDQPAPIVVSAPLLEPLGQVALVEHDRHAEREERRRVTEPPGRAQPGATRSSAPLPPATSVATAARWSGSDACRRPSRIATTHDDEQRRPVREVRDRIVESEHGHLTFGRAWTVIATPTTRITSALTAGRSADEPALEARCG